MPDHPIPVAPGNIYTQRPPDKPETGPTEAQRLSRIIHGRNQVEMHDIGGGKTAYTDYQPGGLELVQQRGTGLRDNRERPPETSKCVDGPTVRRHTDRNPGEFRSEALARAEVDRLQKEDPNGSYVIVNASPFGDLFIVARRGEVQQVLDAAKGNQQPTETEW